MMDTAIQPATDESGEVIPATEIRSSSWRSFILQVSAIVVLFICVLVGHAFWRTGSMALVWPYLVGQRLLFDPTHLVLGAIPKGTQVMEREIRVVNAASTDLRLLGSQKSCGCIALNEFPIMIPAGDEQILRLKIGMPRQPASFEHSIKFFSDDAARSSVVVTISGFVP
jgi:hypothetical protein